MFGQEEFSPIDSNQETLQEGILCILEGKDELNYIVNILKLSGCTKSCDDIANNQKFIQVGWGGDKGFLRNIEECNFNGGNQKGSPSPKPAQEIFQSIEDVNIYHSVIVMFDGDKDINQEVENYFISELKNLDMSKALLVSRPCFESTVIDFCTCGNCRTIANNLPEKLKKGITSHCQKYKIGYSELKCLSKIGKKGANATKHIENISKNTVKHLKKTNSKLSEINLIIQNFYQERILTISLKTI